MSLAMAEMSIKVLLMTETKETQLCSPHNRMEIKLKVHIQLSVSVPGKAV